MPINKPKFVKRGLYFLFILCFVAGFFIFGAFPLLANENDFFRGWVWNDHIGWISMNCADTGRCADVDYGVDMDLATGDITGYAWSENAGWVCFGSTCGGITPEGAPAYAGWDDASGEISGWARMQFENMLDDSWVSLNCSAGADCATLNYKITLNVFDDSVSGWAWNANNFGAANVGLGWFDFSQVIGTKELICDDDWDNDADGFIDCNDIDCACGFEQGEALCTDSVNNDADLRTDCLDHEPDFANSCWHHDPYCSSNEAECYIWNPAMGAWEQPGGMICCHDNTDNDHDNGFGAWDQSLLSGRDCVDTDCAAFCEEICDDGFDNDGDGLVDFDDPDCADEAPGVCDPQHCDGSPCGEIDEVCGTYMEGEEEKECLCIARPWLETQYGHVYAEGGVRGPEAPEGLYNATYCVIAPTGGIEKFTSARDCYLTPEDAYNFPESVNKYTNILGHLDVPGIKNGLYGQVETIADPSEIGASLAGKIYYIQNQDIDFDTIMEIANGIGNQSGAGLVLVEGGDLYFSADMTYSGVQIQKLKNLASIGWIVVQNQVGIGGNIYIDPGVSQLVGAFYAEKMIKTQAGDSQLTVYGLMIARQFDFGRAYSSGLCGAEQIIFDSRALTNPPPGMEDLTRSLPDVEQIVPR
ncbi:hypothetical protein KKD84_00015 [Patescibacteria group bacterium]|nr:hypothetical protein [Patescibacteria group bacterium]